MCYVGSSIQKVNIITIFICLSLFSLDGKKEFPIYGLFLSPKIAFIIVNISSGSYSLSKYPLSGIQYMEDLT